MICLASNDARFLFFFFFLFSSHRVRNWNDTFCISTSIGSYVDEAQIRVRDNHWLGKGRVEMRLGIEEKEDIQKERKGHGRIYSHV